jgi:predicted RNA-binding Zn ribbon-like protein
MTGTISSPSRAGSVSLVGGALALDFANTAAGRGTAQPVEHLRSVDDLLAWAVHARGIDAPMARRVSDAGLSADLLPLTRSLREVIHRIGSAVAAGGEPPAEDLRALKGVAADGIANARLAARDGGYALDFSAAPPVYALLGPLAWSALQLLEHGPLDRLKQCPAEGCGWLFLDSSKNGSRRWCDMASCGNRSKVRALRARR